MARARASPSTPAASKPRANAARRAPPQTAAAKVTKSRGIRRGKIERPCQPAAASVRPSDEPAMPPAGASPEAKPTTAVVTAADSVSPVQVARVIAPPPVLRVAGINIKTSTFTFYAPEHHVAVLRGVFYHCVVPAEQRAEDVQPSDDDEIPVALRMIHLEFPFWPRPNSSVLGPLSTKYAPLTDTLQVLKIDHNDFDESAVLCDFATVAVQLRTLRFNKCGLTSVRGLEGHCEYLRVVDLRSCEHLSNLDGLGGRQYLEEVYVYACSGVTSIEPLRSCPALTIAGLGGCQHLSSIEPLEFHQRLQEVDASSTPITSIEPLRTCPNLTKVYLRLCQELSSIAGLEDHQRLQVVDASQAPIASIEPLRTCPALTEVFFYGCQQLSSIGSLEGHVCLQEVDASHTPIASIEALRTCPALITVNFSFCWQLSSIDALEEHPCLQEVDAAATLITSLVPLRTCPALQKVDLTGCKRLPADAVTFAAKVKVTGLWDS